ncbi:MAG: hypothetical protein KGL39_49620 [Patescibacteria group bacterium]|nr:hypothetical protein [Patescibacteria group bacterium]
MSEHLGDIFAGLAVLISVVTAFIMWLQYRETSGVDSEKVKIEKQGLLGIQLNAVMRRLGDCERRHKECEERSERLEKKYSELRDDHFALLRRFTQGVGSGGGRE